MIYDIGFNVVAMDDDDTVMVNLKLLKGLESIWRG